MMKARMLIISLFLAAPFSVCANSITGMVTRVIDGDTVIVISDLQQTAHKIRLANIDAPEKSQASGKQAADYLSSLILNQAVRIEFSKKDFFGRIIGAVYLRSAASMESGQINRLLVSQGYAWRYRKYSKSKVLAQIESEARKQAKGLWHTAQPVAPWEYRAMRSSKGRSNVK